MHILICGAGAVGSIIAARLAHAGMSVSLLIKPTQNIEEISLEDSTGITVAKPKIITEPETHPYSCIFLCVKTQHLEEVLQKFKGHEQTPVFCFQNGVRAEEIARKKFTHVYGVVAFIGAMLLAPGRVRQLYEQDFVLGPEDETSKKVANVLTTAGFNTQFSDAIISAKWGKLIFNLTNAFLAITGFSYQQVFRDRNAREIMARIMEEGKNVVDKAGIKTASFGNKSVEKIIAKFRDFENHIPPLDAKESYSSTYQDLLLKRKETEVRYLNAEIVELGKRHGIPTPLNDYLLERIGQMTQNKELPGHYVGRDMQNLCVLGGVLQ